MFDLIPWLQLLLWGFGVVACAVVASDREAPPRLTAWAGALVLALPGGIIGGIVGAPLGPRAGLPCELIGLVLGGALGHELGRSVAPGGRSERRFSLFLGFLSTLLYWTAALFVAAFWLFITIIGDCFDNLACQRHKASALGQTLILLIAFAAVYVVALLVAVRRVRKAAP